MNKKSVQIYFAFDYQNPHRIKRNIFYLKITKTERLNNYIEKQAEIEQTRVDNFLKVLDQDPSDVIFGTLPENKIFTPKMTKQQLDNLQKVQEKAKKEIQKLEELELE